MIAFRRSAVTYPTRPKTIDLLSDVYNRGGNCAVNFKRGESYLVYARQREPLLVDEEMKVGQVDLAEEIRSKDEAKQVQREVAGVNDECLSANGVCASCAGGCRHGPATQGQSAQQEYLARESASRTSTRL